MDNVLWFNTDGSTINMTNNIMDDNDEVVYYVSGVDFGMTGNNGNVETGFNPDCVFTWMKDPNYVEKLILKAIPGLNNN